MDVKKNEIMGIIFELIAVISYIGFTFIAAIIMMR